MAHDCINANMYALMYVYSLACNALATHAHTHFTFFSRDTIHSRGTIHLYMAHNCIHDMLCMCYSMHINCHIRALFVNGHRIATNCHVHEWDVVATRFLQQLGELAQSCPFIKFWRSGIDGSVQ